MVDSQALQITVSLIRSDTLGAMLNSVPGRRCSRATLRHAGCPTAAERLPASARADHSSQGFGRANDKKRKGRKARG